MNNQPSESAARNPGVKTALLLVALLLLIFWRSFLPGYVHFSNDGPLGQQNTAWRQLPAAMTGQWDDLNDAGFSAGAPAPTFSTLLLLCLGPLGFAKFYPVCALIILGLGIWSLLRALKLSKLAVTLGTLGGVLNSMYFAGVCWGVASAEIAVGMNFCALALICSNNAETPVLTRWLRIALAGFCVGMNVMEGADNGALCSVMVALFVFYRSLIEPGGQLPAKIIGGISRVAVVAVFAGIIALQTVLSLVSTSIQGVSGMGQDTETKAAHWDWATQWSLPKRETLGLIIPGLFGYKMDTPKDMMPQFAKYYENGVYWGGVGRDPAIDRYLDSGSQGERPASGFMRFTGGGSYVGILVCLLAAWAVSLAFRRENSPFSPVQKKIIYFWVIVLAGSLFLTWGRFAPGSATADGWFGYAFLYHFPYFSTIRNPCKFLTFFCWSLVILSAYGIHAISARNSAERPATNAGPVAHFMNWLARAAAFERKWFWACVALLAFAVIGWLIFASEQNTFVAYLARVGFPGDDRNVNNSGAAIAAFALSQVAWFIPLLAVALVLFLLLISGYFAGNRAKLGAWLLGAFLVFDLVRADLPYVIHWDYKQKYEVGTLNPVVAQLADKPYEHRVAGLPFRVPEGMELFEQLYRIEWMQHHFPYYNIQCLDIIQMPRMPADLKMYLEAISPHDPGSEPLLARRWELSNTRYLLGPAGYLDVMNQQLDPEKHQFQIVQRFEVTPKPGVIQPTRLEELTAVPNENGRYALFEFKGALPRAKLYGHWEVLTNDTAVLHSLGDLKFDPAKTVLVSTPEKDLPAVSTNENSGSVEFKSYSPKRIVFSVNAPTPAVLLLNDKYDSGWTVTVDGKPANLLRCNFLMRGVQVAPGSHTVVFDFTLPSGMLKVTLIATGIATLLALLLLFLPGKKQVPVA
jgi:hypothetical protein